MDRPAGEKSTIDQQLSQRVSSNFSFGFDQNDISKAVSLLAEDAMSVRWQRTPDDDALMTTFTLGPYYVKDATAQARLVVMVPPSAELIDCTYMDMSPRQLTTELQPLSQDSAQCTSSRSETAQFYSTPIVPSQKQQGIYTIFITVGWRKPNLLDLGVGRNLLHLQYQGNVVMESVTDFTPADRVKVLYNVSSLSRQPANSSVFLKYMVHPSETVTDLAPAPDSTRDRTRIWVSTADRATYYLSVYTEGPGARRIFDLAGQGIFLIIGAVVGATVPRARFRRGKEATPGPRTA
jgi:hypothetical protein